ncbi:MAG: HAD-IIIA family hydrolase [Hungatella sp.]|nr:HAD-IIIA family hydrolase [Hungatella sp.]
MRAVIMAGGKGTRLSTINKCIPKPMFPMNGKPVIEYQIESLRKNGVEDIILIVGYLGDVIRKYFDDGSKWGVHISYIIEAVPLGTAGAFYYLKDIIRDDFLLTFGDLIFDADLRRFIDFHKKNKASITLFCHPNSHPFDSDLAVADKENKVIELLSKYEGRNSYYHNLVNSGLYCINERVLKKIKTVQKLDLESEVIKPLIDEKAVFAYRSTEYVKDMGTPDRLTAVENDIRSGLVEKRNFKNLQKAVFLDRDGTINILKGFLKKCDELELLPNTAEAIKKLNNSEYLTIVVTNQPVIARGECTVEDLEEIHKKMETELGKQGAYLDALFYCPHHPDSGFDGEIKELKIECECRKPKIGMLIQAAEQFNIDLRKSFYIGDTTTDIQTGINAGMKTILVKTGEAGEDRKYNVSADYEAKGLLEAVEIILRP